VHSFKFIATALVLIAAAAGTVAACGGDDDSTTSTVQQTATASGTGTGAVETTPGGAVVPAAPSCGQGQIYSQGQGACVSERQGDNPCPAGEIPAADQPVCEPKD
jgi:hypothetical protein